MYGYVYSLFTGRNSKWPTLRSKYLAVNPKCTACGTTEDLEVHHYIPFHARPDLELVWGNLRTMCRAHHWEIGHAGMSWQWWNEHCDEEAALHLANVNHAREVFARFESAA